MISTLHHDEQLLRYWREEQHNIASRVVVPESSFTTSYPASITQTISERYAQLSPRFNDNGETEGEKNYLLIGGVDVSFPAVDEEANEDAVAVYVILKYEINNSSSNNHHHNGVISSSNQPPEVVYRSHTFYKLTTPYIPSYLAFREIDPLLELITQQRKVKPHLTPNVILVDGNGQWHDRYAGLACFVGVQSGIPTVGVGKTFYSLDNEMKKSDVVRDVKQSVQCWYDAHCNQQQDLLSTASEKGCRGVIVVDKESIPYSNNVEVEQESQNLIAYEDMLMTLHQVCSGLAIPMRSGRKKNDTVLAYALVGHGGNNPNNSSSFSKKKNESARGSKNPIYISCGSYISLLDAVSIVAWTSIVRIPEPIREADLHGRQLLREQKN